MKDPLLLPYPVGDVYQWLLVAYANEEYSRTVAKIWYRNMWLRVERQMKPRQFLAVATWHTLEVRYDGSSWTIVRRVFGDEVEVLSTSSDWTAMVCLWDEIESTEIQPVAPYIPPTRSRRQGLRLVK
jgi:hypothetical protein